MNKSVSAIELRSMLERHEPIQLVDVRSPGEYEAGHVPQAINIPLEQLESRFDDIASGQIAVLCQSGRRAGLACDTLKDRHHGLWLVEGGTQAWLKEGYPTVASVTSKWSLERQVRLGAGLMVLTGTILSSLGFYPCLYLAMFVGAGLTFAGLTNICGMALLLAKLPWNRPATRPLGLSREVSQS